MRHRRTRRRRRRHGRASLAPRLGHPRSEKRGAAASRPASAGGADSSRSASRSASSSVGRIRDLLDRTVQVVLEPDLIVPRQDIDPRRAQCVLHDRADDLFDPVTGVGRLEIPSDVGCFPCGDRSGRHGRPRDHSRHRNHPVPPVLRIPFAEPRGRGRESSHGGGRSSCRSASKGMCRARMIRPTGQTWAPPTTLTFGFRGRRRSRVCGAQRRRRGPRGHRLTKAGPPTAPKTRFDPPNRMFRLGLRAYRSNSDRRGRDQRLDLAGIEPDASVRAVDGRAGPRECIERLVAEHLDPDLGQNA